MKSALYAGHIYHTRHIPKIHTFRYPFFMWFLDLEEIEKGISFGKWFSSVSFALSRFKRTDYLGNESESLAISVKKEMLKLTGQPVQGKVFGLMNLRTLGLYFSPVNFYYGFDKAGKPSHFLAEVANIPWNERHYYGHLLAAGENSPINAKDFKVSPFNPENNQTYKWKISQPGENLEINLGVHDKRGHIFEAALRLQENPFNLNIMRRFLRRTPAMTLLIVSRIYWQALRIFLKGIPYISYKKEGK